MNFRQFIYILRARFGIVLFAFLMTVATTAIITYLMPRTYTSSTSLVIDFRSGDPLGASVLPVQFSSSYMATQLDIITSQRVAGKVVDELNLIDHPVMRDRFFKATRGKGAIREWIANYLLENLQVEPSRDSRLVIIHFSSTDSQFAAIAANTFAQEYIETNLELSIEPARQSTAWFREQLKGVRSQLKQSQAKLTAYQQERGIVVATDERLDTETARLATLSNQLATAQSLTYEAETRWRQLESTSKSERAIEALPEVRSNSFIQRLKANLLANQTELEELSGQLGANHPQYQNKKAEVVSLQKKLDKELNAVISSIRDAARLAREREESIELSLAEQKNKVLRLKQQRDEVELLAREVQNSQQAYDTALQRYSQINLESQVNQTNIAVLTEAVEPVIPSSPAVVLNMILSVFLGGLLGVGIAFVLEISDRRVRSEDDLLDALEVPVLGVLVKGSA